MHLSISSSAILICILLSIQSRAQWSTDKSTGNPVSTVAITGQVSGETITNESGELLVAWWDERTLAGQGVMTLFVQKLNANGQPLWAINGVSANITVHPNGNNSPALINNTIQLLTDSAGGVYLVALTAPLNETTNIVAQHINQQGVAEWNNGNPVIVCNAAENQHKIKLVRTGNTMVVVWQDHRNGQSSIDIYAQKINKNGTMAWQANGVIVNAAFSNQENPDIIPLPNEEIMATWDDFRNSTHTDIYAQRLNAGGVRQWVGNDGLLSGRIICTNTGFQRQPRICSDGANGAIIAWNDSRNENMTGLDVYAQRITIDGTTLWQAGGKLIAGNSFSEEVAQLIAVGDGAVACMNTYTTQSITRDIWAQKVLINGDNAWGNHGKPVCTEQARQLLFQSGADGEGGVVLSWADDREGASRQQVFGQRLNSNGDPLWAVNGIAVNNFLSSQINKVSLAILGCKLIFTWSFIRSAIMNFDYDIYATALDCSGNTWAGNIEKTWTGAVSSDWNNPDNWLEGMVPGETDHVIISGNHPHLPVIAAGAHIIIQSLSLKNGASIALGADAQLTVLK